MSAAGPARKTHSDVLRANTGWKIDPVQWARRAAASKQLTAQTERIASALTRAGVDVVRPGDVTLISAVTGIVESLPIYRAVRFLPTVAARDRRPMVNGLKLFMAGHRNSKYFRYAVMTCSEPVPAFGDLRGSIQALSRRISKWSNWVQKYGIKVLFRGIEFTRATAAERKMADRYPAETILYHVHANVIYWPTRNIEDEWPEFLKETHSYMGAEWKDNGAVKRVEEIVKYCSKPADTLAASDDELVWLYQQTTRLKIAQPLGDFKAWLRDLAERGEKVVRVQVREGDGRLMRVRKQRRVGFYDTEDDVSDEPEADDDAGEVARPERVERDKRMSDGPPANIVLGMSLPQWRHSPWAEPMIMIQHYDPAKLSLEDGGDIRAWQRQAREWWDETWAPPPEEALRVAKMAMEAEMPEDDIREAAEAATYIVHTCRPTVPVTEIEELDDDEVEEIDEEVRDIMSVFEGRFIRLIPPIPTEDDEIPYETPEQARRRIEDMAWREQQRRDQCRLAA